MKHAHTSTDLFFMRHRLEITLAVCLMFSLCVFQWFVLMTQTTHATNEYTILLQTIQEIPQPLFKASNGNLTREAHELTFDTIQESLKPVLIASNNNPIRNAHKPTLDIMCRTFNGALFEILRFILTYLLFFPRDMIHTQIVLVFDAENDLDHMTASVLETAYKDLGVKVFFEEPPPPGTLTALVRDEGFSRTQWSNFYSDLYSSADFIGMIDSDTEFAFRPSIEKHMIMNMSNPVMFGIHIQDCPFYPCVKYMIGMEAVAEFMYVFPFIVKREHLAFMRKHIVKTTGLATFEQAWWEMQNRFSSWGQFSIMGNYLYHFHHDEYVWDIVYNPISTVASPCPHVGKNLPMHQNVDNTVKRYHHQMCMQSRNIASECKGLNSMDTEIAKSVPFTDYWPIDRGANGHDYPGYNYIASKEHYGTTTRSHQEVFDERIDEIFASGGESFWYKTRYNTSDRTKNPTTIIA